ncbi:hypothetical protein [Streptomyces sp. YIM S03343]
MTASAIEVVADGGTDVWEGPEGGPEGLPRDGGGPDGVSLVAPMPRPACTITADGAYAARLARARGPIGDRPGGHPADASNGPGPNAHPGPGPADDAWYPERWTLDGPEPYAVPLPGARPEAPGTDVQPMGDGRVLIRRTIAARRHTFALLYPTGPGTGELPLGTVECPDEDSRLRLLPPAPCGERAYALVVGRYTSELWLVAGGGHGPELLAEIPGRCSGGVWLDRAGRMLALDREVAGLTKAVVVDLERGGEVSPLLQIADRSADRVLLADPDSGLLLVRSDAPSPGQDRLGWGVLGSTLPVRFPECLRLPDCVVTPFAVQPGQMLQPEGCAVALRIDGALGSWVGVWRPAERYVHHLAPPDGWLTGTGLWTPEGVLRLPYATPEVPCGVARLTVPVRPPGAPKPVMAVKSVNSAGPAGAVGTSAQVNRPDGAVGPGSVQPAAPRPVPLQQAPLTARAATR